MRWLPAPVALVAALAAPTSAPGPDVPPIHDDTPEVAAGTHLVDMDWFGAPFLLTMPDGWTADADFVVWGPRTSYISWWVPTAVARNSCSWQQMPMTQVATAAELAAVMVGQEGSLVGSPQPLTLGEAAGVQFTVAPDPFQGVDCDTGRQVVWQNTGQGDWRWFNGGNEAFTVWALDLAVGLRAFTIGSVTPLLPDESDELLDVAESIVFVDS